eukprot:CAMPEP_0167755626 /NCGR_PEP_ID=MMETSP0110_2-20121227/8933_1 /TAXON_ID=629695 /ORGANISM="Gymnochlora sp., Strain CCMP2014" /LENGTH=336 /DNA_ID=CAMNT_0007641643 /DNA_START=1782 /DNA_END=2792 /DNA_ORIENTATION=+
MLSRKLAEALKARRNKTLGSSLKSTSNNNEKRETKDASHQKRKRKRKRKGNTNSIEKKTKGRKKNRQLKVGMGQATLRPSQPSSSITHPRPSATSSTNKLRERLQGAQFRWLNEKLYTCRGDEAFKYFRSNPGQFKKYHAGFVKQAKSWTTNPLDEMIDTVKRHPKWVVGDFGCGEARLSASVSNVVHSFDLVADNERITACDMANVPLANSTLDAAIFCLSLMGTNIPDFIQEANRCLKPNGTLLIAEVISRMSIGGILNESPFIDAISDEGFQLKSRRILSKMFILMTFRKIESRKQKGKAHSSKKKRKSSESKNSKTGKEPSTLLAPCLYKKR